MAFNQWVGAITPAFAQLPLEKATPRHRDVLKGLWGPTRNPLTDAALEWADRYGTMLASPVEEVLLSPRGPALPSKTGHDDEMVTLHLGPATTEPNWKR